MNSFHEYLKGILQQILDSYQILSELNDKPEDLQTINQEFSKIKGFLQVIKNKLSEMKHNSFVDGKAKFKAEDLAKEAMNEIIKETMQETIKKEYQLESASREIIDEKEKKKSK